MNSPDYKFLRTMGQTTIDPIRFMSFAPQSGTIRFAEYQDPNNWYVKDNSMARNNTETNFRIETADNGFILTYGGYNSGSGNRYVFNTVKELNEFITEFNTKEFKQ